MSKHRKRGGVARNRNTGRQDHWGAGDEIFDAEVDDGRFDEPSEYVLVSLEERAAEAARRAGVATERPSTDASWTDLDAASCVVVMFGAGSRLCSMSCFHLCTLNFPFF